MSARRCAEENVKSSPYYANVLCVCNISFLLHIIYFLLACYVFAYQADIVCLMTLTNLWLPAWCEQTPSNKHITVFFMLDVISADLQQHAEPPHLLLHDGDHVRQTADHSAAIWGHTTQHNTVTVVLDTNTRPQWRTRHCVWTLKTPPGGDVQEEERRVFERQLSTFALKTRLCTACLKMCRMSLEES